MGKKILFAGLLASRSSASWQRCHTLTGLGHQVVACEMDQFSDLRQRWIMRHVDGQAFTRRNLAAANGLLIEQAIRHRPEVIWLDKGILFEPYTLAKIKSSQPEVRLVAFQDDNPFGDRKHEAPFWESFLACIALYDLHLVKRSEDLVNFRRAGARRVEIFRNGYFQDHFRLDYLDRCGKRFSDDVSFLGTAMDGRGSVISKLILDEGLTVQVYGARWNRTVIFYRARANFHGVLEESSRLALFNGSKINLGFVSLSNHDEYTGRSFEIPASGGFLLAMRTPAHCSLYQEGIEAEFFADAGECADKIRFYLRNEEARKHVAQAGYQRCMREDYSLKRGMKEAMELVESLA